MKAKVGFMPHLTLFYGAEPVSLHAIEPILFAVTDFALVHSELGLTRYNTVRHWWLGD